MEQDYEVLSHLQDNHFTAWRRISSCTGFSFCAINLLKARERL